MEKTREQKIEKIYEVISNKELSAGCIVILKVEDVGYDPNGGNGGGGYGGNDVFVKGIYVNEDLALDQDKLGHYVKRIERDEKTFEALEVEYIEMEIDKDVYCEYIYDGNLDKIIGHPVMIGDVLYWYEKQPENEGYSNWYGCTLAFWEDKRNPIEDQPDNCIDYIYNLLPDEQLQ